MRIYLEKMRQFYISNFIISYVILFISKNMYLSDDSS